MGNWGGRPKPIKQKSSKFHDQRFITYNNYRAKILLNLLKILQMTFLVRF